MEQLNYNLLFRWFVGLEMDDAVWLIRGGKTTKVLSDMDLGGIPNVGCASRAPGRGAGPAGQPLEVGQQPLRETPG